MIRYVSLMSVQVSLKFYFKAPPPGIGNGQWGGRGPALSPLDPSLEPCYTVISLVGLETILGTLSCLPYCVSNILNRLNVLARLKGLSHEIKDFSVVGGIGGKPCLL